PLSHLSHPPTFTTFPYTTLFRSQLIHHCDIERIVFEKKRGAMTAVAVNGRVRRTRVGSKPNSVATGRIEIEAKLIIVAAGAVATDRKSTRLNSSHQIISYAVFCL